MIPAALAHCPSGEVSAYDCEHNGAYTTVCVAPTVAAPTRAWVVTGADGKPPTVVTAANGALGQFVRDGGDTLHVAAGGALYRVLNADDPFPAQMRIERGGYEVSRVSCTQAETGSDDPPLYPVIADAPSKLPDAPLLPPVTQCGPGEKEVLGCRMGAKVMSICESPAGQQYRFGPPGKPELVWPPKPAPNSFAERDVDNPHGDGISYWTFDNGGYHYEIWSAEGRPEFGHPSGSGIHVTRSGAKIADLDCDYELRVAPSADR